MVLARLMRGGCVHIVGELFCTTRTRYPLVAVDELDDLAGMDAEPTLSMNQYRCTSHSETLIAAYTYTAATHVKPPRPSFR